MSTVWIRASARNGAQSHCTSARTYARALPEHVAVVVNASAPRIIPLVIEIYEVWSLELSSFDHCVTVPPLHEPHGHCSDAHALVSFLVGLVFHSVLMPRYATTPSGKTSFANER